MPKSQRHVDRDQFWRETVAAWKSSGQKVTAFCAARGLAQATFYVKRRTLALPDPTVQAWANGTANHGWVFINTGGNGWDFYTSEFDDVKQRPKLVVEFSPPKE